MRLTLALRMGIGRGRMIVLVALNLTFALTFPSMPADATNINQWRASNDYNGVGFGMCNLNDRFHNAYHANDSHDIAPTDITSGEAHGVCTPANTVDVTMHKGDYGPGWSGYAECHYMSYRGICDSAHVHINTYYGLWTDGEALHLMCMEIGHTVGLDHSGAGDSCMNDGQWGLRHLNAHDKNIINQQY
jgi:hypothetical protein